MMNKERELLIRARDVLRGLKETHYHLYWDIQTALDQPEQEPVGIVITIGGYPDDSEHTVKLTCRHRDLKDGDLLYTAPPKQEPINFDLERMKLAVAPVSDVTVEGLINKVKSNRVFYQEGYAQALVDFKKQNQHTV
jgi:hypothetical protein